MKYNVPIIASLLAAILLLAGCRNASVSNTPAATAATTVPTTQPETTAAATEATTQPTETTAPTATTEAPTTGTNRASRYSPSARRTTPNPTTAPRSSNSNNRSNASKR